MKIKLVFIILFISLSCSDKKQKNEHPNIVYILADDLGYGELGVFGQKIIETPNIDQLAKEGMILTNHYSGCLLYTSPSPRDRQKSRMPSSA